MREPGATYEMYENLFKNPLHRVFVYGTLKRGEPNHGIIKDVANGYAKFLGVGKTTTSYPLVIATKYNIPFLLKKPNVGNVSRSTKSVYLICLAFSLIMQPISLYCWSSTCRGRCTTWTLRC